MNNIDVLDTDILENITDCTCYTQYQIDNIIKYSKKLKNLRIVMCKNFFIPNDIILDKLSIVRG